MCPVPVRDAVPPRAGPGRAPGHDDPHDAAGPAGPADDHGRGPDEGPYEGPDDDAHYWDRTAEEPWEADLRHEADPLAGEPLQSAEDAQDTATDVDPHRDRPPRRLARAVQRMTPRQLMVLLAVVHFGAAVPAMLAGMLTEPTPQITALMASYDARAQSVLDGTWRADLGSVVTAGPLLDLLLVIPYLLGGGMAYGVLFNVITMMTGMMLWMGLQHAHKGLAVAVMLLFVTNPFSWGTGIVLMQPGTVLPFFVALALVAFTRGRPARSAAWLGGAALYRPAGGAGLLFVILGVRDGAVRLRALVGFSLPIILLAFVLRVATPSPFAALGQLTAGLPARLLERPRYGSLSVWAFLHDHGIPVPTWLLATLFMAGLLFFAWRVARARLAPVCALAMGYVLFVLLDPDALFGTYVLLLAVALPWAVLRRRRAFELFALSLLVAALHAIVRHGAAPGTLWGLAGIALAGLVAGYLYQWLRDIPRSAAFLPAWRDVAFPSTSAAHPSGPPAWETAVAGSLVVVGLSLASAWAYLLAAVVV